MIEERTPVSAVKVIVGEHVLLCEYPFGKCGRVEVAEHQARIVAPRHELVHLAAVDLRLLLIETVYEVAG